MKQNHIDKMMAFYARASKIYQSNDLQQVLMMYNMTNKTAHTIEELKGIFFHHIHKLEKQIFDDIIDAKYYCPIFDGLNLRYDPTAEGDVLYFKFETRGIKGW